MEQILGSPEREEGKVKKKPHELLSVAKLAMVSLKRQAQDFENNKFLLIESTTNVV